MGDPVGGGNQGAQALVAAHHIGQRRAQRVGIQAPRNRHATAML